MYMMAKPPLRCIDDLNEIGQILQKADLQDREAMVSGGSL